METIKNWDCEKDVVEMTSELIRMPSINPPGDMREVSSFVEEYVRRLGLSVETIESRPGMTNIVATLDAGEGPTLVFNGHMDVIPPGDPERWDWDPFGGDVRNGYVHGRGASDMKGGLAGLLVALKKIVTFTDLKGKILFMAVPDEESGGDYGTRMLVEKGYIGDACLIAEPSGQNPTIGQKGNLWLHAKTRGVSGHGSLSPLVGVNAIREMSRVIDTIYELWDINWSLPESERSLIAESQDILKDEGMADPAEVLGRVSVNLGRICGGEKVNVIPGACEAEFDLRIPIGLSTDEVLNELNRRLARLGIDSASVLPKTPPREANYTNPLHPFVQAVTTAIETISGGPSRPMLQWASSDSRYFRYRGIPTVQFGPAELDGIHGVNERVSVSSLVQSTRVYALLARRMLTEGSLV